MRVALLHQCERQREIHKHDLTKEKLLNNKNKNTKANWLSLDNKMVGDKLPYP